MIITLNFFLSIKFIKQDPANELLPKTKIFFILFLLFFFSILYICIPVPSLITIISIWVKSSVLLNRLDIEDKIDKGKNPPGGLRAKGLRKLKEKVTGKSKGGMAKRKAKK